MGLKALRFQEYFRRVTYFHLTDSLVNISTEIIKTTIYSQFQQKM